MSMKLAHPHTVLVKVMSHVRFEQPPRLHRSIGRKLAASSLSILDHIADSNGPQQASLCASHMQPPDVPHMCNEDCC